MRQAAHALSISFASDASAWRAPALAAVARAALASVQSRRGEHAALVPTLSTFACHALAGAPKAVLKLLEADGGVALFTAALAEHLLAEPTGEDGGMGMIDRLCASSRRALARSSARAAQDAEWQDR